MLHIFRVMGLAAVATVAAVLAACGGGGGVTEEPPASAALADNNVVATALATEARASIAAAGRVPGDMGPSQLGDLVGFVGSGSNVGGKLTVACAVSGSISADLPANLVLLTAGKAYSINFNSCEQVGGVVTSGLLSLSFGSVTDVNNFSQTATYNITTTTNGKSTTYAGNQACTVASGKASCTFNDGARSFAGNFSQTGGALNGSYSWAYGTAATVDFSFSNWTSAAGSVVVTGPNKFRATIERDGANAFNVVINGGVPRRIVLPG